jgi:bifunctional non-homologous end joining protein LigD
MRRPNAGKLIAFLCSFANSRAGTEEPRPLFIQMPRTALKNRGAAAGMPAAAREAPYPGFVQPCDPTLREQAPRGDEWLHETKLDGYRAQVHLRAGRTTIYSRQGHDWTEQFGIIARAAKYLPAREAILDGEAVVTGEKGVPDFQALRRALGRRGGAMIYVAFDLLYLDGFDLRDAGLMDRKRMLERLLAAPPDVFVYLGYLEADGPIVYQRACALGLEGVVSKRGNAPYRSGRQDTWIKVKCTKSDSYPIVAFVEKLGAHPRKIASLYIGRQEAAKLLYAGKVRTGYTEETARELRERLDPLIIGKSPLSQPVKKPKATWVQPVLKAEVEYSSITDDGLLREAVFKGLRDDLPIAQPKPKPARRSRPRQLKNSVGVPRENILQLLPDAVAPSKDELRAYWRRVAARALVYLGRRPLKLVRHTRGTTFYHMGSLPTIPGAVHQLHIEKREGGEGVRVWVDSLDGLLGLVDLGAVELHPWAATVDDIEHPDHLVFDLDPGEGISWEVVVDTALQLRDLLQDEGLESWPKLTGGKGVHLMVPIARGMTHDTARAYCRRLAHRLERSRPRLYTISAAPQRRSGRIFIDFLRNGRGTTAVGAYSPRAKPGFPIAAPATWEQLMRRIRPNAYTMHSPLRPTR